MQKIFQKISYGFAFTYPCPRKLREVVKMSLIEREPKDQVVKLWMEYHRGKPNQVSYVMSKHEYEIFNSKSAESPLFLLPLKRQNGHFMIMGQSQSKSILYTYLEDYKKHGTFVNPYFIMTLFDELLFSKEIVLVRGDILIGVDNDEAFYLMNQTMRQYLQPELYNDFIYTLNHSQEEFDYEKYRQVFQL